MLRHGVEVSVSAMPFFQARANSLPLYASYSVSLGAAQAEGLADAVRALQAQLGRLEGDDLAAASEQEALATSLAAVLSRWVVARVDIRVGVRIWPAGCPTPGLRCIAVWQADANLFDLVSAMLRQLMPCTLRVRQV